MFAPRFSTLNDRDKIFALYKAVAKMPGGIAREEDEITAAYIGSFMEKAAVSGIQLVLENPENPVELIAEIHCYKLGPRVFSHVLGELTIVVHPSFQGKGAGRALFKYLLNYIEEERRDIMRVELIARESNKKAISFYKSLGFEQEGRLEKRVCPPKGDYEADIPMAWFNRNFAL